MITLIVARARNGAIGRDGTMPWHLPEDLAVFQRETTGGAVIMGRRTWESLPVRPLKRRLNIVISSRADVAETVFPDVAAAVEHAYAAGFNRLYGIGGNRLYAEMFDLADRLLVTEVSLDVPDADTFFPDFEDVDWRCIRRTELRGDAPACVLHEYLRRRP